MLTAHGSELEMGDAHPTVARENDTSSSLPPPPPPPHQLNLEIRIMCVDAVTKQTMPSLLSSVLASVGKHETRSRCTINHAKATELKERDVYVRSGSRGFGNERLRANRSV
ncbi:hypothetical protein C4D60_Mb07t06540 [Musa balbisiana]|uniref:Uncharacterized protein n=1 Tax=Musa balbisiana TaxID=52838 RepID=A0A4S8JDE8_MUSBA|nr:hypothetical protein C4D60_Mb07t06540 [Musa balbisiana]